MFFSHLPLYIYNTNMSDDKLKNKVLLDCSNDFIPCCPHSRGPILTSMFWYPRPHPSLCCPCFSPPPNLPLPALPSPSGQGHCLCSPSSAAQLHPEHTTPLLATSSTTDFLGLCSLSTFDLSSYYRWQDAVVGGERGLSRLLWTTKPWWTAACRVLIHIPTQTQSAASLLCLSMNICIQIHSNDGSSVKFTIS